MHIPYLEIDNNIIHYQWHNSETASEKNVLVLVHGLGLDLNSWNLLLPLLKKEYRILQLDLQGHGNSGFNGLTPILDVMTHDIHRLIHHLGIKQFHIVGHGFGGFVAIQYSYQYCEEVLSLTLISVPVNYPVKLAEKQITKRKEHSRHSESLESLGKELIPKICYQLTEENEQILLESFRRVNKKVYFMLFHTEFNKSMQKYLKALDTPILLLTGAEDPVYPPELFSITLNLVPYARFLTVPDAAFAVQLDQPAIVAKWIHQFIQQKSVARDNLTYNYLADLSNEIRSELTIQNQKDQPPNNTIRVNILNRFEVFINGQTILQGWGKRKAKLLFVYLILQKSVTRDELCDVFWPDLPLDKAKNQLRVSLHHLKKIIEHAHLRENSPIVVTEREHVMISGVIHSDYLIYKELLQNSLKLTDPNQKITAYEESLTVISDNLFPGLYNDYFLRICYQIERVWADMAEFLSDWYNQMGDKQKAKKYQEIMEQLGYTNRYDIKL
ncbi:alpha/beta hydrolase [Gracilibacillus kekensis]|uniref:Pimeloyl-ACP methyl ester carboxylesterase n=1 Tax=Gracilibacillus kekensis TaxID=1027249 RepID=A0A1M7NX14_9BACI|nr:alpha/beta hydrolase [Gracilibacillus kekensis]SHN08171.1 Pimeloyl-ACP methyl ester carboxylesterase [Gracilibacillus kekensis]